MEKVLEKVKKLGEQYNSQATRKEVAEALGDLAETLSGDTTTFGICPVCGREVSILPTLELIRELGI